MYSNKTCTNLWDRNNSSLLQRTYRDSAKLYTRSGRLVSRNELVVSSSTTRIEPKTSGNVQESMWTARSTHERSSQEFRLRSAPTRSNAHVQRARTRSARNVRRCCLEKKVLRELKSKNWNIEIIIGFYFSKWWWWKFLNLIEFCRFLGHRAGLLSVLYRWLFELIFNVRIRVCAYKKVKSAFNKGFQFI